MCIYMYICICRFWHNWSESNRVLQKAGDIIIKCINGDNKDEDEDEDLSL